MQSSLFEEPAPYILVVPCQMHRALSDSFAYLCPAVAQTSQSLSSFAASGSTSPGWPCSTPSIEKRCRPCELDWSSFAASGSTNPDWPCSTPATDSLSPSYDVAQP